MSPRVALLFVLAFSAGAGLLCVLQYRGSPFFNLPIIDEESYVSWAERIAGGDILGSEIFYQDPLYPYFLALLFSLFGKSLLLVRVVHVLLGAGSVALVFFAARRLLGDWPAVAAAGILALYRGLYFFELLILKATLVVFLSALCLWLGVAAADQAEQKRYWFFLGFVFGLLILLRGNFLALIPLLAAWPLFYRYPADSWKKRTLRSALSLAGLILVLGPVAARNYYVGGELVLTTSQGGANFYIGNNERANGRYVTLPFVRANPKWESKDFKAEAEKRAGRPLTSSEVSSFWFRESFKWIRAHPGEWFKLLILKTRLMIHNYEIPDNNSFYLIRDLFAPMLWLPFLGFGLLWGPALAGMFVVCRRDARAWFPALFVLLYVFSIIPFFIVARYRVAVVPGMALFAAAFLGWARERWRARDRKALGLASAFIGLFLFLGFYPTPVSRSPMGVEYYLLGNAYLKTGRPEEAVRWYDKALSVLPEHADALKNRAEAMRRIHGTDLSFLKGELLRKDATAEDLMDTGRRLEQLGDYSLALAAYKRAASIKPDFYPAWARMGFLYATRPEIRNLEKAVACLEKALELDPGNIDTMNALGNAHFMAGDTAEARRLWETALEINPAHKGARQNLEMLKLSKERKP